MIARELVVYNINFRTSKYNTLSEKLNALTNQQDVLNIVSGNVTAIGKRYNASESFDEVELFGRGNNDKPLIQLVATSGNTWYSQKMDPLMYELYAYNDNKIDWRNVADLTDNYTNNVAPMRAVKLHNNLNGEGYMLTDDMLNSPTAEPKQDDITLAYYLSYYCSRDFHELRNKAATAYLKEDVDFIPEPASRLINAPGYTDLMEGGYGLKFNYILPGTSHAHFSKDFSIPFLSGSSNTLVIENNFDAGTEGWETGGGLEEYASITNDAGRLKVEAKVNGSGVRKLLPTAATKQYSYSMDVDKADCASLVITARDKNGTNIQVQQVTTNGRVEITFTALSDITYLYINKETTGTLFYIDNIKLQSL
jgi:hypothetical protein